MGSLMDTEDYKRMRANERALSGSGVPEGMFKSVTGEYKPRFTKQDLVSLDKQHVPVAMTPEQPPQEQDVMAAIQARTEATPPPAGALPGNYPMQPTPEPPITQMTGNPDAPPLQSMGGSLPVEDYTKAPREIQGAPPEQGKAIGFSEEKPTPSVDQVKEMIKSPVGIDAAVKSAEAIKGAGKDLKAADIVKSQGGKKGIEKQLTEVTKDMPPAVKKSIWDLTTQQKGAWLMDFGLRLMAASDRPGTSVAGAIGRAGMGTINAMREEQGREQAGALAAEQKAYDRKMDRLRLEQGNKRIAASTANTGRQYRATDTEKYRARQLQAIKKEFPKMDQDQAGFLADKLTDSRVLIRDLMKRPAMAMADLEEEIRKNGYTVTMPDGRAKNLNPKRAMEYFNKHPDEKKKIIDKRVRVALTGNEQLYDFALRIKNSGLSDVKAVEVIDKETQGALPKSEIKKVVKSIKDEGQQKDKLDIRKYL